MYCIVIRFLCVCGGRRRVVPCLCIDVWPRQCPDGDLHYSRRWSGREGAPILLVLRRLSPSPPRLWPGGGAEGCLLPAGWRCREWLSWVRTAQRCILRSRHYIRYRVSAAVTRPGELSVSDVWDTVTGQLSEWGAGR